MVELAVKEVGEELLFKVREEKHAIAEQVPHRKLEQVRPFINDSKQAILVRPGSCLIITYPHACSGSLSPGSN